MQVFALREEPSPDCERLSNPLRCHCQARPPPQRRRPDPGGATDKVGERPFPFQLLVIDPLAYLSGRSRHRRTDRSVVFVSLCQILCRVRSDVLGQLAQRR